MEAIEDKKMDDIKKEVGAVLAMGYDAFQKARIRAVNHVRNIVYRIVEGLDLYQVQQKKEKKSYEKKYADKELMLKLEQCFLEGKITRDVNDYLHEAWVLVKGGEKDKKMKCPECKAKFIDTERFSGVKQTEAHFKTMMERHVMSEPIYIHYLSKIRGIGPLLSTRLINAFGTCEFTIIDTKKNKIIAKESESNVDKFLYLIHYRPERYRTRGYLKVSHLRARCGMHVVNGVAPKLKKGMKINFSPQLRALIWLASTSLIKQNKGYYRKAYDEYKARQTRMEYPPGMLLKQYPSYKKRKKSGDGSEVMEVASYKEDSTKLTKGHVNNRAIRKVGVLLISHYWEAARELAGLSHERTYVEEVLHHEIVTWKQALEMEGSLNNS